MINLVISSNLATYKELKYEFTIDDFIAVYEIAMVNNYNKQIMMSERKGL